MAKVSKSKGSEKMEINPPHRTTSIGNSVNTRPKNKHARRSFKKYRGQGK